MVTPLKTRWKEVGKMQNNEERRVKLNTYLIQNQVLIGGGKTNEDIAGLT